MMRTSKAVSIALLAVVTFTSVDAVAAPVGLPVPFQPAQSIEYRSAAVAISGQFLASDGVCKVDLRASDGSSTEARHIKAGGKSRVRFGDSEIEVFCCPQLTLVTLREVRRPVALTN